MLAGTGVAAAQESPPSSDQPQVRPHTVVPGDTLSRISLAELGSVDRWSDIFAVNRDALASPDLIEVGQVLDIPAAPAAVSENASPQEASPPAEQPPERPHTVARGESLSTISQAELGAADRWVEIFAVNSDTLADPDVVAVGQVLDIPTAPVAVPADLLASLAPAPAPAPVPAPAPASVASAQPAAARQAATPAPTSSYSGGGGAGGHLASIRACESSGNYAAVSPDGLYHGAYQFDRPTWQSVGGTGDPAAASPAEQDARAAELWNQRGSNPWPNCG